MNTITIAQIKSGGMAALDEALLHGAATIIKRNRPAAIVLTPKAYELLLSNAERKHKNPSAIDWLLTSASTARLPAGRGLKGDAMAKRLKDLKAGWPER